VFEPDDNDDETADTDAPGAADTDVPTPTSVDLPNPPSFRAPSDSFFDDALMNLPQLTLDEGEHTSQQRSPATPHTDPLAPPLPPAREPSGIPPRAANAARNARDAALLEGEMVDVPPPPAFDDDAETLIRLPGQAGPIPGRGGVSAEELTPT